MPTYKITLPDGRKARVTANSIEEADAAVTEMLGAEKQQPVANSQQTQTQQPVASAQQPQSVASSLGRVTGGLGMPGEFLQSAAEVPAGLVQFAANRIPGLGGLAEPVNKAIAEQRAAYEAQRQQEADQRIAAIKADPKWQAMAANPATAQAAQYLVSREQPTTTAAGVAGSLAGGYALPGARALSAAGAPVRAMIPAFAPSAAVAERVAAAAAPVASRVSPVASVAAPIARGAATGAVYSQAATQPGQVGVPVTPEQYAEESNARALLGAAVGGAIPAAGMGAARAVRPWGGEDVQTLRAMGVRPTVGQTLGGTARNIEEKARSVPILGNAISYAEQGAQREFREGLADQALKRIGEKVDRGVSSEELIKTTGDKISAYYDKTVARWSAPARADTTLVSDINKDLAMTRGMPQEVEDNVRRFVQNNLQRRAAQGIDGATFKEMDSAINQKIAATANQEEKSVYREIRNSLRDFAARKNPGVAEDLKKADAAWSELATLESAGARAGMGAEGPSVSNIATASKMADQSVRKRAVARGESQNQGQIQAAARVLGNRVPDSGTAGRGLIAAPLTGVVGAMNVPATLAGLAAGSAPYLARRTISDLMSGGGAVRNPAADFIRRQAVNPTYSTLGAILANRENE